MTEVRKHKIIDIVPGSIAMELEIEPGDCLLAVDGREVKDVFDYRYLINEEFITVQIEKADGEIWELEIEKDYSEDLGLVFESGLMDEYQSCRNHCIFCFIDQMPPGMRPTLYFKDDDARLSFLQGNYVTLTNMSDEDIDRIIRFRLEPVNISFQAMNPETRCRMLRNRFAGDALNKAVRLYDAGITMNGQIVLCRGINDGSELDYSLQKLSELAPVLGSVSVVPVGLTRFREGLFPLEAFDREAALKLLDQIRPWREKMMKKHGIHFVHASDEWYILAGRPVPEEDEYDGYPQLENGVGMIRLLQQEFDEALGKIKGDRRERRLTVATGKLAAPFIRRHAAELSKKFERICVRVVEIENRFFGSKITVSGLITGNDLAEQLAGEDLGEALLLPCNMLREQEEVFLDDMTVAELQKKLQVPVVIVQEGGGALLNAFIDPFLQAEHRRRQIYEQTDCGSGGET